MRQFALAREFGGRDDCGRGGVLTVMKQSEARASGMRVWLLAGALGAVVVLVACGSAGLTARGSAAGPSGRGGPSGPRELLDQLVLPARAQRLRVAPRGDGGILKQPQETPGTSQLTDLHRIWRVHAPYPSGKGLVETHLPRGAQWSTGGHLGGPGIPENNSESSYSFPTKGDNSVFWLDLAFVALPHGWTGIRADALIGSCPCIRH